MSLVNLTATFLLSFVLIALAPAEKNEKAANATSLKFPKSSDTDNSSGSGLDRIKQHDSLGGQHSAQQAHQAGSGNLNEEMEKGLLERKEAKREAESLPNISNEQSEIFDERKEKVTSHEAESRSNSSSSVKSPERLSGAHPLFSVDRHQGDGSRPSVPAKSNSHSSGEIAHDHVVRYQIHQTSEEDSAEDASFKAPVTSTTHGKVSGAVQGNPNYFPVRVGPNVVRIQGSNTGSNDSGKGEMKGANIPPIPLVRQDPALHKIPQNHDSDHD